MKKLIIIQSRLKQYRAKNRLIFALFIIGGVINTILLAYMYGNLRPEAYNYNSSISVYREYRVLFDYHVSTNDDGSINGVGFNNPDRNHVDKEDLKKLFDTGLFESITVQSAYPSYDSSKGERIHSISACVYGTLYENFIASGQRTLTSNDQVIVDILDEARLGDSIVIRGREFEVVAKGSDIDIFGYMITPEAYYEIGPYSNGFIAYSNQRWHEDSEEGDVAADAIRSIFPECYVWKSSKIYEAADKQVSVRETRNMILTYAVSQIAYVFLLSYLADSLSEENSVSIIVGAKPSGISFSVFLEGLILSSISGLAGIMIHRLLYRTVFSRINAIDGIVYFLKDYLSVFGIVILASAVVLLVYALRFLRRSPIDLKNRFGITLNK